MFVSIVNYYSKRRLYKHTEEKGGRLGATLGWNGHSDQVWHVQCLNWHWAPFASLYGVVRFDNFPEHLYSRPIKIRFVNNDSGYSLDLDLELSTGASHTFTLSDTGSIKRLFAQRGKEGSKGLGFTSNPRWQSCEDQRWFFVTNCPSSGFIQHSLLHNEWPVEVVVRRPITATSPLLVFKTYKAKTMGRRYTTLQDQVRHEIAVLIALQGVAHMVQLRSFYFSTPCKVVLIFPFLKGDYVPRQEAKIQSYIRQLLEALAHLFTRGLVHCNIKGENVIFDEFNNLTLIDFESVVYRSELIGLDRSRIMDYGGNPCYTAPEMLQEQPGWNKYGPTLYGRSRDMYSAGVILAELMIGAEHIFSGRRSLVERQQLREHLNLNNHDSRQAFLNFLKDRYPSRAFLSTFEESGFGLAAKMLEWDRFERIRPKEALEHQFLS